MSRTQTYADQKVVTIVYTSGTTGSLKGVMLTGQNILSSVEATCERLRFTKDDHHFSFLPMAHILERMAVLCLLYSGSCITFHSGNAATVLNEALKAKPTIMVGVPRIWNRVVEFLKLNSSGPKFQLRIGLSAAAPLREEVAVFLQNHVCEHFYQCYGLTETSAGVTCSIEGNPTNVGKPFSSCEIKLVDVPELGYEGRSHCEGEVCIRGSNVFLGYFKDEKATAEVFADGWFLSGDIGRISQDGSLAIIDRKKHILKLSQGVYVHPEVVEEKYLSYPGILQCFVHGESTKSHLVGILIVNAIEFEKNFGLTISDILQSNEAQENALHDINQFVREKGLSGLEVIQKAVFLQEPFSIENGLLTPTLKAKRRNILSRFKADLERLLETID